MFVAKTWLTRGHYLCALWCLPSSHPHLQGEDAGKKLPHGQRGHLVTGEPLLCWCKDRG